jgi:hypothetical protein
LLGILSTLVRGHRRHGPLPRRRAAGAVDDRLRADIGLLAHSSLCYGELTALENLSSSRPCTACDRRRGPGPRAPRRGRARAAARARRCAPTRAAWCSDWRWPARSWPGRRCCSSTSRSPASIAAARWRWARRLGQAKADGAIVVCVTHDLEAIAGVTDHVAILRRGKLACDERDPAGYSTRRCASTTTAMPS